MEGWYAIKGEFGILEVEKFSRTEIETFGWFQKFS